MKIAVHAKGFELTAALEKHAETSLTKALERFAKSLRSVQVHLDLADGPKDAGLHRCRLRLVGAPGNAAPIEATGKGPQAAIDAAAENAMWWLERTIGSKTHGPAKPGGRDSIRPPTGIGGKER